jgi:poly-gamma-glutamate synthesis protein (capsule biosynthesis protein)
MSWRFVVLVGLTACAPKTRATPETRAPRESVQEAAQAVPPVDSQAEPPVEAPYQLPEDYLRFSAACVEGDRATIAAGGDLLTHRELQKQAFGADDGFRNIWSAIGDLLKAPDLTYLNLEGPLGHGLDRDFAEVPDPGQVFDNVVYTGYPRFNYHPSVAKDLKKAGVDVVSTANNHALDRGPLGADRTIESLRKAGVKYVGTRKQGDESARWYTTTKAGELTLAWVACTRHTNRVPDDLHQVLRCDTDRREIGKLIRKLVKRKNLDAVIVTPHQGKEYSPEPREKEVERVHGWLEAGALAVLGSHPHVLQPWEKYLTQDGRETFVIYSLGNFASHQPELPRRSSLLLYLGFTRGEDGQTRVNGVRYVPLHVREDDKKYFTEAIDRVRSHADSRALTAAMFGLGNLQDPDKPVVTDPHCDPDWRPAPVPDWAHLAEPPAAAEPTAAEAGS